MKIFPSNVNSLDQCKLIFEMKIDYWDENYSLKCKFVAEMKFQYRDENSSQLRSTNVTKKR